MMTKTYEVGQMSCGGCANAVRRAIENTGADVTVDVDLDRQQVRVEGDLTSDAVERAVNEAGFEYRGEIG